MESNNKYSIIMAVYEKDDPLYFNIALNSLMIQTLQPEEIILVENGPINYEISKVIEKYDRQLNICRIKIDKNKGLAYALNIGLRECQNEYIARMDCDDICLPTRFEKQIRFLKENLKVDVVGSWIEEVDEFGNSIKIVRFPFSHIECFKMFRKRNPLAHPSVMFRKRYFEIAGKYDETAFFDQDSLLWMNGFKYGCIFGNIQEVLLKFRQTRKMLKRRNGINTGKLIYKHRLLIISELNYGIIEKIYALLIFLVYVSPIPIKKFIYKYFR